MRVAIACDGDQVSAHFGRCERYLVAVVDDGDPRLVKWLANPGHEPGAIPALMAREQVNVVIAGGAGPRAQQLLSAAGIDLIWGVEGEAVQVLAEFAAGTLVTGDSACEH
jgi:predicted Fe-Mo cluster-binding NifX family protein